MEYRGFRIYADVLTTHRYSFEVDSNGNIEFGYELDQSDALSENIDRFVIENPDDDEIDEESTLEEAKKYIDHIVEDREQAEAIEHYLTSDQEQAA